MIAGQSSALRSGQPIPRGEVPRLSLEEFRGSILDAVARGQRVAAPFGDLASPDGEVDLLAVVADGHRSLLRVAKTTLERDHFPSLTPECPQVHLFERELAEQYGARPEGHPRLNPVRFHSSYRPGHDAWEREPGAIPVVGVADFYRVEGEEIHEVAVGPIHAGVIEPGHFRFQCHGEQVFHLEISLGYQHRGAERTLVGGPDNRTIHTMETVSSDTSIGHATAYCQAVEGLGGCQVPIRAQVLRGVALELERLANHTGDLGALAGDVGFLPTASYCGRLRGDFLNLTALLCGSRFGRGMVRPGGVGFDLDEEGRVEASRRLDATTRPLANAVNLLWNSTSVQARFDGTGALSRKTANALGLVGPPARACGLESDVRHDFPAGIFRFAQVPVSSWTTGDVFARAYVRWLEIQCSLTFNQEQLRALPDGPIRAAVGPLKADHLIVSLVEGWRGEICHVALTDAQGRLARYKIVDPSFHNWMALAMALRDQQISDFPLCNKSFNGQGLRLDLGRCLFCTDCTDACPEGTLRYSRDHRLATRTRDELVLEGQTLKLADALEAGSRRLFGRSLKLRQVSAGGCNACEADLNVLGTVVFDLGRFGVQFAASPHHADGLVVTGAVSENKRTALLESSAAVPAPKLVIAVGACAISGGPYLDNPEVHKGCATLLPIDLYIPGCPPHP